MSKGLSIALASLLFILLLAGCALPQNATGIPANLEPKLYELMLAEKRGEAEAFAKPLNIQIIDGSVRVQIDAKPGQAEAAARAAQRIGARVDAIAYDTLSALVPIRQLVALAEAKSIRSIHLPRRPAYGPPQPTQK